MCSCRRFLDLGLCIVYVLTRCISYKPKTAQFSNNFSFTGFAFVYMEDERDAEDAIRRLDRTEFGRKGRRLRVEWTKVLLVITWFI